MGFIYWIIMGLVAGVLAKLIMPGKDPGGVIITILVGIVGALVGGLAGQFLGIGAVTDFNIPSILLASGGAVLLLLFHRMIKS